MHIVFYGAGGIGGYFGARLLAAGANVSFIARGKHAQAMRDNGLHVVSPLGNVQVAVPAVHDDPAALKPADLVVFAVKMFDAESAATRLGPLMQPGTVVLPLQNGVEVSELLARHVGAAAVALGTAYIPAKILSPGVIGHAGTVARLRFGALQPAQQAMLEAFAAACTHAQIDHEQVADMAGAMWEKFVLLVGLSSVTALTRMPIGIVRSEAQTRELLRTVMAETAALAAAEGHPLAAGFVEQQMAMVDGLPETAKSSMANDLDAGRPIELPWLAGAVQRRAERLGVATPACAFICAALAPFVNGAPELPG